MPQFACKFDIEDSSLAICNYLVYLPQGYNEWEDKKWPLILFLHGAGERGNNAELIKKYGIPNIVDSNTDFQFIVVSPQCPLDTKWVFETHVLNKFLEYVLKAYRVDPDRVYLTGLSLGGQGTWKLASEHPEKFAAIAPVCGHKYLEGVHNIKTLPVWVFHGAKDTVINIKESEEMVAELERQGTEVSFTIYPEASHDSWTETYNNPELYKWFLSHKKSK